LNQRQTIELYQPMLHSIAFKILKCKEDAEDLVQETFIKWLAIDQEKIQNAKAYLITSVTNTCLNHLNSLRKQKEEYIENFKKSDFKKWFKDPDFSHLDAETELKAALSIAISKLEPLERAVFLLKEIFNLDYENIQEVLEKKQDHCRQILCRARKKIKERTNKISINIPRRNNLLSSFTNACNGGDIGDLIAELKKDISSVFNK